MQQNRHFESSGSSDFFGHLIQSWQKIIVSTECLRTNYGDAHIFEHGYHKGRPIVVTEFCKAAGIGRSFFYEEVKTRSHQGSLRFSRAPSSRSVSLRGVAGRAHPAERAGSWPSVSSISARTDQTALSLVFPISSAVGLPEGHLSAAIRSAQSHLIRPKSRKLLHQLHHGPLGRLRYE